MNADVQALLTKADESAAAARLLRRENFLSFAASRAYYAMFYAAEAALLERGLSFSSHAAVIAAFGRELTKPKIIAPRLHRNLIHAFNLRNVGDYDARPDFTAEQVDELIQWMAEFVGQIKSLLSDSASPHPNE